MRFGFCSGLVGVAGSMGRLVACFMRFMRCPVFLRLRAMSRGVAVATMPGRGQMDALLGHAFEDLQRDFVIVCIEGGGIGRVIPIGEGDGNGVVAEPHLHQGREFGLQAFMVFEEAPDQSDEAAQSLGRGV